jgi:hypothetical protein
MLCAKVKSSVASAQRKVQYMFCHVQKSKASAEKRSSFLCFVKKKLRQKEEATF